MDLIDEFLTIENKYGLLNRHIGEIYYWRCYRFHVLEKMNMAVCGFEKAHREKKGLFSQIIKCAKLVFFSCIYHNKMHKGDYLIINHPRRVLKNGVYECIYTSKLAENYNSKLVYERIYDHKRPAYEKQIYYGDRIAIVSNLVALIHKILKTNKYRKVRKQINNDVFLALSELIGEFGVDYKIITSLENELIKQFFVCERKYKCYSKLIRIVQPKVVIETVSYSADCMLVNRICKGKGIPTIELQHGIIDPSHIAYNYGDATEVEEFPEYVFTFSDFWKEITKAPLKCEKLISVGFPYYERERERALQKNELIEKNGICFVSQGTIGRELSILAVELSKCLDLNKWHIYYKLHPGEYSDWREKYCELSDSLITVVSSGDLELYDVFARSVIQVGVYSTALFEGIGFGLDTLIYKKHFSESFDKACELGYAKYINDAKDIVAECDLIGKNEGKNKLTEYFWKQNSLSSIISEIDKIIESKNEV